MAYNHDGRNDLAGVGKQEKYMVEGTERLDHDGMEANNRCVSIRLTDMVHYHRVFWAKCENISFQIVIFYGYRRGLKLIHVLMAPPAIRCFCLIFHIDMCHPISAS